MKTLNTILTVLFWAALVIGLLPLIKGFDMLNYLPAESNAAERTIGITGVITGNLFAYATIPGIIWVIRYFVRKNMKQTDTAAGTK